MALDRLIAVGDSHLDALKYAAELGLLDISTSSFSIVPGATAVGLRNPNAVTDAINIFKGALADESRNSCVLIHLGEVDCGFVIWWRANKLGESVQAQLEASIDAYRKFVLDIMAMGFENICITGASLPTLRDEVDFGTVANKRAEIKISIAERTQLTFFYNQKLRSIAKDLAIRYFDITDALLDRRSGLVHDFYRNDDLLDHHLNKFKVVGIWAAKFNSLTADH